MLYLDGFKQILLSIRMEFRVFKNFFSCFFIGSIDADIPSNPNILSNALQFINMFSKEAILLKKRQFLYTTNVPNQFADFGKMLFGFFVIHDSE